MTLEGERLLELHSSVSVASGMSHHYIIYIIIIYYIILYIYIYIIYILYIIYIIYILYHSMAIGCYVMVSSLSRRQSSTESFTVSFLQRVLVHIKQLNRSQ